MVGPAPRGRRGACPAGGVGQGRPTLGGDGRVGGAAPGAVWSAPPQHCGPPAGEYFPLAPDAGLPGDQNGDDAMSVCWQGAPLDAPLDILGRPVLRLRIALDQPRGNLIARLVDLHPDGAANLIARGVLNLCPRGGNAAPEAVAPGDFYHVTLALDETGYRLAPGHRLRLALSTAYWPLVLPGPRAVTATIRLGAGAELILPLLGDAPEAPPPLPADPEPLAPCPVQTQGHRRRHVEHDLQSGRVRYVLSEDGGWSENPVHFMASRETRDEVWEIDPADPEGATGHLVFTAERKRGGWHAATRAEIRFTCAAESYRVEAELTAREGEVELFRKTWSFEVARDHM